MENAVEDEKKPFDAEAAQLEDSNQPDPDEELMLSQGSGRAWLVKVPKFLMERWAALDEDDMHLATIRIYSDPEKPQEKPRIILFLPPNRDPVNAPPPKPAPSPSSIPTPPASQPLSTNTSQSSINGSQQPAGPSLAHPNILNWPQFAMGKTIPTQGNEPDIYELEMVSDSVDNQIIVAERPLYAPPHPQAHNSRARTTILTGRIKHEVNLRPALTALYRKQMRERHLKYNTPIRQIMRIEDANIGGGRGGINRLSSGVGVGAGSAFSDLVRTKPKPAKGTFERMARMPKNQLLDQLFSLYAEQPRWGLKALRERTQQPESYLKEVLSEVATINRSGEHNGMWELKATYRTDPSIKPEALAGPSGTGGDVQMEDAEDYDDEDDDEEDDMEEIS